VGHTHYSGNEIAGPGSHHGTPRLNNYEHRLLSSV
jgi:hypothetical protein